MTDPVDPLLPATTELHATAMRAPSVARAMTAGTAEPSQAAANHARRVHRAIGELRRGVPVILEGEAPVAMLPAEGASMAGLRDLAGLSAASPSLLLAGMRAAQVSRRAVPDEAMLAFALPEGEFDPELLRGLADPTAEQFLAQPQVEVEVPRSAGAVLMLVKLARLLPAAIVVPLDQGQDGAGTDLIRVSTDAVLEYPLAAAARLTRVAEAKVPLEDAPEARLVAFRSPDAGIEHLALLVGRPEDREAPLVRLHSECFTGDLLGSVRCDCGPQLRQAIRRMAAEGAGILLYLAQEGRGIGLVNKLRAYALQDSGLDTLDANLALGWGVDERSFLAAATMLEALDVRRIRLLTNNPAKVAALQACGIDVVARLSHAIVANGVNDKYLAAKAERLGHLYS